jgi:uncharacterized repeat protein (TIGR01451 family)
MTTQVTIRSISCATNLRSLTRIAAFVAVIVFMLIIIPNSSSSSTSSSKHAGGTTPSVTNDHYRKPGIVATLDRAELVQLSSFSGVVLGSGRSAQETIATFADDCSTPKAAFFLGETVCAKTDNVDLNFPGGRWVHWLRQDLSIAYGGNGVTDITTNPQFFTFTPDALGSWKVSIAETGDISQTPAVFTVSLAPESIITYDSTCTVPRNSFTVGSTVCAKADSNFSGTRYIHWVNSQGEAVHTNVISSNNASAARTILTAGNWWVYFSDSDGSLRSKHAFTVSDPQDPQVDLSVSKTKGSEEVFAGGFISFVVDASNKGPDTAGSVTLTEPIPANATFVSTSQDSGPIFTCSTDSVKTECHIASLQPGQTSLFTFVYQVNSGTPAGTVVSETATISSNTSEIHEPDNSALGAGYVLTTTPAAACTLDCPNDIVATATTHGQGGGAIVTFGAAEGFGNCGTISSSPASGSFFPIGTTTVITTSSLGGGGCSFTVNVVDTAAPTISCPANLTVTANSGQSHAFVPDPNGSSSNVGTPTASGDQPLEVTGSREDGDGLITAYPIGTTDITWLATDPSGRQATCTQQITVLPNQVLTISCPTNVTVASPTGCDPAAVNVGQATSNSQTATVTAHRSDDLQLTDPYPIGTTNITWTSTDTDTQSVSCSQTVTVTGTDTTPPTLTVPPNVSVATGSCTATLDDELGVAVADDDCGTVSITRTGIPTFPCPTPEDPNRRCESFVFPTGTTVITYKATNSAGLFTTGTQTVTVTEDPAVSPTITAPADVTLYTGADATSCGVLVTDLDSTLGTATASDNCPGVTVARLDVPPGSVFPLGNTTITYKATDKNGNVATDTQVVTVGDNTPPVVTAPANVTLYTGPGATSCGHTVNDLDGALGTGSASDNCPGVGAVARSGVPAGNVFPVGTTTLTYSATDAHNNTGQATQIVTVIDNTAPTISCPTNITLEPTCPTGAIASWTAPIGSDNCPGATTSQTAGLAPGSVFSIGTTTITYTVNDAHGNSTSCSFTVTVLTPQAVIQNMIGVVNSLHLSGEQRQGLLSKLNSALDAINENKINVACNKLADFNSQVQSFINNGTLTSAQGQPLIGSANHVRNTIGCTSLPCS